MIKQQNFDFNMLVVLISVSIIAFSVTQYWDVSGGDPEIHLIFAKNLLDGYPLQFNKGEFTSGETSPVYMVFAATLMLLFGNYTIIALKLVGVLSVIGIFTIILRSLKNSDLNANQKLILAIPFFLLPSIWYQVFLGMENMLFAFACLLIVHFYIENDDGLLKQLSYLIVLPILFFLRPEATLLFALLFFLAVKERHFRSAGFLILAAIISLVVFFTIEFLTGVPLHAAGAIRAYLSKQSSLHILGFYVSKKPLYACLYTLPFALIIFLKMRSVISFSEKTILFFLTALPLTLHFFNIFPNVHFSRYFLYGLAAFFYVYAKMAIRIEDRKNIINLTGYAILFLVFTAVPLELYQRSFLSRSSYQKTIFDFSNQGVENLSNELYEKLGEPKTPVVIALTEVQIRGRLDDRFIIRSLDGILDYRLKGFLNPTWIDHVGYLKDRNVAYLLAYPNYNIDKEKFSLNTILNKEHYCTDNLIFNKLNLENWKIHKITQGACTD
jgi:hypothetical protein